MAKINTKQSRARTAGPMKTVAQDTKTFEGAPAYSRDAKSDLFLLAVTNFFGEDSFYEKADARGDRFVQLVRTVAKQDPEWILGFLPWLRKKANIRTAAVVGAVEAAQALREKGQTGPCAGYARQIIEKTLARADEPAEAVAYALKTFGRRLSAPVRRGIADAAVKFYNERNLIKYDSSSNGVRMADVLNLVHPDPRDQVQSDLFKYILDSRRDPKTPVPERLRMIRKRRTFLGLSTEQRNQFLELNEPEFTSEALTEAGITWEQAASWGSFDKKTWEALVPTMGYMALLRNLRNLQMGLSEKVMKEVAARIGDQKAVLESRQLPYRFLSAYLEAGSPFWALPLETALQHSLGNVPALPGRTLVLVDVSGSMLGLMSGNSKMQATMVGALFGIALALKGLDVDLYSFDTSVHKFEFRKGSGVLRETERFGQTMLYGGGTDIAGAVRNTYKGHDRVVIITDEQTFGSNRLIGGGYRAVAHEVPANVPMYAFNLRGYAPAMMEASSTRHQLGGLTDQTFALIPMLEAGQTAKWPWEE